MTRSLSELVSSLVGTKQRTILHLRSGRDASGVVAEIVAGRSEDLIVLVREDRSTFIPFSALEAVTVDGVRPTAKEEPPTRLAARRLVEEHARRMSKALGVDIEVKAPFDETEAGEAMRALVERSEAAAKAIEGAARDEMGKSAIASRVKKVVMTDDVGLSVWLDGDTLAFGAKHCDVQATLESLF